MRILPVISRASHRSGNGRKRQLNILQCLAVAKPTHLSVRETCHTSAHDGGRPPLDVCAESAHRWRVCHSKARRNGASSHSCLSKGRSRTKPLKSGTARPVRKDFLSEQPEKRLGEKRSRRTAKLGQRRNAVDVRGAPRKPRAIRNQPQHAVPGTFQAAHRLAGVELGVPTHLDILCDWI